MDVAFATLALCLSFGHAGMAGAAAAAYKDGGAACAVRFMGLPT
ncbi:hypothetical protein AncyloWKF20_08625 [Ancylobacter sp. WKF20]|nr:hypothetical protein [Ancylobacter sp. WKF20]WGD31868.1 hypothetical protein AncyloWKF20_08625 [Ancylobacter sp. WKF20]